MARRFKLLCVPNGNEEPLSRRIVSIVCPEWKGGVWLVDFYLLCVPNGREEWLVDLYVLCVPNGR